MNYLFWFLLLAFYVLLFYLGKQIKISMQQESKNIILVNIILSQSRTMSVTKRKHGFRLLENTRRQDSQA